MDNIFQSLLSRDNLTTKRKGLEIKKHFQQNSYYIKVCFQFEDISFLNINFLQEKKEH